jgi:hypothetical protein
MLRPSNLKSCIAQVKDAEQRDLDEEKAPGGMPSAQGYGPVWACLLLMAPAA